MLNGCSLCLVRLSVARLMTCCVPRRAPINGLRNRGERRPCPTTSGGWARGEPVALTLTALAPQLFRDLVVRSFCVSRFTVNKKAQNIVHSWGARKPNRFYMDGVIGRLSMLAASYELESTDPEAEVYD